MFIVPCTNDGTLFEVVLVLAAVTKLCLKLGSKSVDTIMTSISFK